MTLPTIIFATLFIITLILAIFSDSIDTTNTWIVGRTRYTKLTLGEKLSKRYFVDETGGEHPIQKWQNNYIFVRCSDRCEKWKENDILVFEKGDTGENFKDKYILLRNRDEDKYRIAYCIAESAGFPPIFDRQETLIDHEIIGILRYTFPLI